MRLAVLSDIHANLHALEATWTDLKAQRPDAVVCLGDLVGYGALPNEVVDFIRASGLPSHFADLLETGGLVPTLRLEGA